MTNSNRLSTISKPCVFTIDVEDGISLAMRDIFKKDIKQSERVVTNTLSILRLLEKYGVKATFFFLGKVAEDFPDLVRQVANAGHEIGVHGYNHFQVFNLSPQTFKREISTAKKILEDISGQMVMGHRAPAFSINPSTAWALDVISECGFVYDSSIMPIQSQKHGWNNFPKGVTKINTTAGELWEIPMPVYNILGFNLPFSGGSYFRLLPAMLSECAINLYSKKSNTILYLHPYEVDAVRYPENYFDELSKLPILQQIKLRSNWINRSKSLKKWERIVAANKFITMCELVNSQKNQLAAC